MRIVCAGALLALGLFVWGCTSEPKFKGRDFSYGPAPDFRLADQNGQLVALSEQRGKVVVLTFMYTNCRDVCPLTAAKLSQAYDALGDAAQHVTFLVISSDPENDTLPAVQHFTRTFHMDGKWHYLIGTRPQLEAVWKSYYVAAQKIPLTPDGSDPRREDVMHSTSVLLVDKQGAFRLKHDSDFAPVDLAQDIRLLVSA